LLESVALLHQAGKDVTRPAENPTGRVEQISAGVDGGARADRNQQA
jgi:hypothetical protein